MSDKLLKGPEIAATLAISRSQAFSLMQRGDIPTVRFGKLVRVRKEDLDQFIEGHRNADGRSEMETRLSAGTAGLATLEVNPPSKKRAQA